MKHALKHKLLRIQAICLFGLTLVFTSCGTTKSVNSAIKNAALPQPNQVLAIINKVNTHWQETHPEPASAFWHPAAYQTGNIEAYKVTGNEDFLDYATAWAKHNEFKGAKSDDKSAWKYSYGEGPEYVLFGDWQIAFQTYIDLYTIEGSKDPSKIARAREVMEYEMSTPENDYWWWADGLYMVMPVMTKLYKVTGNEQYLDKLSEFRQLVLIIFSYLNSV